MHRDLPQTLSKADYIAFLVNYFESAIRLPFELFPGMFLRKATAEERTVFQPYDQAAHLDKQDHRITRTRISLGTGAVTSQTNEDFSGYVIEFQLRHWARYGYEVHSMFDRLELACCLAESTLRPVLVCEVGAALKPFFFSHDLHRHTVLRRLALRTFLSQIPRFTSADVAEIRDLVARIQKLSSSDSFVLEAIDRFKQIELISYDSDFHVFGLFTIVEYLLTHPPKQDDGSDSLTKQVSAKCPSVVEQFTHPSVIADFFDEMTDEKGWKILYGYRSAIAHGGRTDFDKRFNKGGFRELKSRDAVLAFLHQFTRRLLKFALCDPARVTALKAM